LLTPIATLQHHPLSAKTAALHQEFALETEGHLQFTIGAVGIENSNWRVPYALSLPSSNVTVSDVAARRSLHFGHICDFLDLIAELRGNLLQHGDVAIT
jgi:hypothetical protein